MCIRDNIRVLSVFIFLASGVNFWRIFIKPWRCHIIHEKQEKKKSKIINTSPLSSSENGVYTKSSQVSIIFSVFCNLFFPTKVITHKNTIKAAWNNLRQFSCLYSMCWPFSDVEKKYEEGRSGWLCCNVVLFYHKRRCY